MTLDELNRLPAADAHAAFERCCGAGAWVARMCAARPFRHEAQLFDEAERAADALADADWLEAFSHHPRIGDLAALRQRFAATAAWAGDEQRGAAGAPEVVLRLLEAGNRAYESRFGYIFIVCATGRGAAEMLGDLQARLMNDPATEITIAAGEQRKITRLRLEKLLDGA